LNIYAHLCRENGMPVEELKIVVMLSNWQKGEAKYKQNYPQSPIVIIPLRLWSPEECEAFIDKKLKDIIEATQLDDKELATKFPCSDKERWADSQGWVVMKYGGKKATKKFETEKEANEFWLAMDVKKRREYFVEERKSDPTRCLDWCEAATVCVQWRREKGELTLGESEREEALF